MNLGMIYTESTTPTKDPKKGFKWIKKAAEQEYALAQFGLASMHYNGIGTPKNEHAAYTWLLKSAENNSVNAQLALGAIYAQGTQELSQNPDKAVKWYRVAAEQGSAIAQYELATIFFEGKIIPKDQEEAAKLYLDAAKQGFALAQNNLGVMYAEGFGVEQNIIEAYAWVDTAVTQDVERSEQLREAITRLMSDRTLAKARRLSVEYFKYSNIESDADQYLKNRASIPTKPTIPPEDISFKSPDITHLIDKTLREQEASKVEAIDKNKKPEMVVRNYIAGLTSRQELIESIVLPPDFSFHSGSGKGSLIEAIESLDPNDLLIEAIDTDDVYRPVGPAEEAQYKQVLREKAHEAAVEEHGPAPIRAIKGAAIGVAGITRDIGQFVGTEIEPLLNAGEAAITTDGNVKTKLEAFRESFNEEAKLWYDPEWDPRKNPDQLEMIEGEIKRLNLNPYGKFASDIRSAQSQMDMFTTSALIEHELQELQTVASYGTAGVAGYNIGKLIFIIGIVAFLLVVALCVLHFISSRFKN